ncbi:hypothetical protein ACFOQM_17905 [Paenibacillus sp. GCM10012307]|uniref:Uncharacterized protein n=1 Tax=Paenibacillus roseus TaxID=2798579 RepID=A0A934MMA8_9BACL|nr:hypothetical protein [Paenibacillus roseus]MBJ6363100.1 hypothetical protein [Paenibacillus roseus]
MNEQPAAKRSWFAPIVLLLLVFSIMGNVVLFSTKIQNSQTFRMEAGERIIKAAWDARKHAQSLLASLEQLKKGTSATERIEAKQNIGFAFEHAQGLPQLIKEALARHEGEHEGQKRTAEIFIAEIEASLSLIGNHDTALTAEETAYVAKLKKLYTEIDSRLAEFPYDEISKESALRTENGEGWVDLAYGLLLLINEPDKLTVK